MNKKIVSALFLTLALIISNTAFSETQSEEEIDEPTEQTTELVETEPAEVEALESGIGWQLIRVMELGNTGKRVYMVLIEQDRYTDKTIYGNAITRLCADEEDFCRVRFWSQERYIPERISLTIEQNKQLKTEYTFDRAAKIDQTRVSCSVEPSRVDCVP
jgi:hypothetical protein